MRVQISMEFDKCFRRFNKAAGKRVKISVYPVALKKGTVTRHAA